MKWIAKILYTAISIFILFCSINSNAFDIALFPMRVGYKGWCINTTIELYNNMTEDIEMKLYAINPTNHTRYNDTGIYDTITEGYNMKEFIDLPNLSWVKIPDRVVLPAKSDENYTVTKVPVIVEIPQEYKYSGKHYEVLICAEAENNGNIHISLASRLMIETPEMARTIPFTDMLSIILTIFTALLIRKFR